MAIKFLGLASVLLAVVAFSQFTVGTVEEKLAEVRKLDATGTKAAAVRAAGILKGISRTPMEPEQRDDWLRFSRDTAIRTADAEWLKELSKEKNGFSTEHVYTVLLAYGKLSVGDYDAAEKLLDSVNMDEINLRDSRRAEAIRVRIAALKGDKATEREYLEKMIEHLPKWPGPGCQTCHDIASKPDAVTSLPLKTLWFAEQYVELLRESGDAEKVKLESEALLKRDPNDDLAKMRLGYALRALGETARGNAVLDSIPYAESDGNLSPKPRMFFAFP